MYVTSSSVSAIRRSTFPAGEGKVAPALVGGATVVIHNTVVTRTDKLPFVHLTTLRGRYTTFYEEPKIFSPLVAH